MSNLKIVAVVESYGLHGAHWEKGKEGHVLVSECRKDKEGNLKFDEDGLLIPPPHFRFADPKAAAEASERAKKAIASKPAPPEPEAPKQPEPPKEPAAEAESAKAPAKGGKKK